MPTRHPAALPSLGAHLAYELAAGEQPGAQLRNGLFDVLHAVHEAGSIAHAARRLGVSYRYTWGMLKKWEAELGHELVSWTQGQPAHLTPFALRLAWAERRARARVQPQLEALRADLARMLVEARDERQQVLTLCASHDLALPVLARHAAAAASLHVELRWQRSVDALRALNAGRCMVAGFQVPALRGAAPEFARALKPLLRPGVHKLIGCVRRRQGLMMRGDHGGVIRSFGDLARARLRFVNRQPGSGTRLLMDHLVGEHGMDTRLLPGHDDNIEESHVAVAACVASGVADVGLGIEAAASEFGLHFVPLVDEDYFLACLKPNLETPAVQRLRALLAAPSWAAQVAALEGYAPASAPGQVLVMTAALPWWRYGPKRVLAERPAPAARSPARVPR